MIHKFNLEYKVKISERLPLIYLFAKSRTASEGLVLSVKIKDDGSKIITTPFHKPISKYSI